LSTPRSAELLADSQGKSSISESGGATVGAIELDLERFAVDLRGRLTADECRRLAELLSVVEKE
jgi:hypothetical protein